MPVPVEANFHNDLRAYFLAELACLGATPLPDSTSVELVVQAYYNIRWRSIARMPRRAHVSRELLSRMDPNRRSRLDEIINEIESGEDLAPRLSRYVLQRPLYNDKLLNDWGIHHLHVGPRSRPHGEELLYLAVGGENAFLLDWQAHGTNSFADQGLVQIIHDNWPVVIRHRIAIGMVPGSLNPPSRTPEDRQLMRGGGPHGNVTAFTTLTQVVDGTIYEPMVVFADGTLMNVRRLTYAQLNRAIDREDFVRNNSDALVEAVNRYNGTRPSRLQLKYLVPDINASHFQVEVLHIPLRITFPA